MRYFSIQGTAAVIPSPEDSWTHEIPATMKRRDPRIWHMAFVAAQRCIVQCSARPASVVVATALGALDETKNFLDGIYTDGFGSPKNFIASVHNSMAGKLALDFKISGPNLTLCDGANSFASAVAACGLLSPVDFPVLVVAVDEHIELLGRLAPNVSAQCRRDLENGKHEGAIAFVVGHEPIGILPRIGSSGAQFIGNADPDAACRDHAAKAGNGPPCEVVAPSKNGGGFLAAAIGAYLFTADPRSHRRVIGSFSPSSKSISLVDLCR